MIYEVSQDKQHPGDWRAEAIDFTNEGNCYVTIFSGPDSEHRANEYAKFKNNSEGQPFDPSK